MSRAFHCAAVAALAATLLAAVSAAAAPSVTLSPKANHPSSQVKVSGAGFGANKLIDLYWDATDELLAVSNATGAFSKSIPVPASALPGTHWVSAGERGSGNGAQAVFTVRTDWVEHGFGARGRRYNPYENVISPANAANLDVAWTYTTGGIVESSPAVVGGIVYIGSNDGYLYALNATTGALKWKHNVGGVDYSSPAVANGIVYIGSSGTNKFFALDVATGKVKWFDYMDDPMEGSPTVANGVVYIGTNNGSLYALDPVAGNPNWIAHTNGGLPIFSAPAIAGGAVYTGAGDHNVYAFSAAGGNQLWNITTGDPVLSSPVVADGWVYIGSYDHRLWAITVDGDGGSGATITTGDVILSSPAFANRVIYFGSADGLLCEPHSRTSFHGHELDASADGAIYSSPAVANGVAYFGSSGFYLPGALSAVDATTGTLLWEEQTNGSITSSPAVADGMVYVGSYDHNVYAYALDAGANAAYRRNLARPSFASLHPNFHLSPAR